MFVYVEQPLQICVMKYVNAQGQILSQTSSSDTDSLFACPGGGAAQMNMQVPEFTPAQHEAFRDELAEMVASSLDPKVVGAFSINGNKFVQRRGVTYTFFVDGREQRIESDEPNASIERIEVAEGIESALNDRIRFAPPLRNYKLTRITTTWGSLKQG